MDPLVRLRRFCPRTFSSIFAFAVASALPALAMAQASPFQGGADNLVTSLTDLATPIAILAVMALAVVALTGRISWGWPIGAILGIAVVFGAPQIVTWVRGLFSV